MKQAIRHNFFCVGAQKAGTTTLHDILVQHPDVFLPKIKETKFFADPEKYKMGLTYYINEYFKEIEGKTIVGEVDPEYMYYEDVPKRIYETLGNEIKFIFMLRNPVERAFSHYKMSLSRGYETFSFLDAIEAEEDRLSDFNYEKFWLSKRNNLSYLNRGYYSQQIERFIEYFPKENMLFVIFEDELIKNKEETLKSIYHFLNIEEKATIDITKESNKATKYKSKFVLDLINNENILKSILKLFIKSNTREKLRALIKKLNSEDSHDRLKNEDAIYVYNKYFRDEIDKLELLINKNLNGWKYLNG